MAFFVYMDNHTLAVLEYNRLLDLLAGQALSEPGARLCRELTPVLTPDEAGLNWRLIDEAREIYRLEGSPPLSGLPDIEPVMDQLVTEGVSLAPLDLVLVGQAVRTIRLVKKFIQVHQDKAPLLQGRAADLPAMEDLENLLSRSISPEGDILDTASRKLAQIRRDVLTTRSEIRSRLTGLIRAPELKQALQDEIITERSGRYVIPLKASSFRAVPGLVHDTSASGATSYVEPLEVVEENNCLNILKSEEKREIDRILAELSREVAARRFQLEPACLVLAEMDRVFASGVMSLRTRACAPILDAEQGFDLRQARHPLLMAKPEAAGHKVIPLDLRLSRDHRVMILSGVNAGGKTAALKTAGLLCLMAQSGLHIPVGEGSRLSFFDRVIAAAGDEQDLQSDLSTFSGHIRRIKEVLLLATDRSLVLLDELGTGTDPAEGAALALALIQEFMDRGTMVMIATHFHLLKAYALQTPGAVNASVRTDGQGRPAFGLEYGSPGFSSGLNMARTLGLDASIVSRAESFMDDGQKQSQRLMETLEQERAALVALRRDQQTLNDELESARARMEQDEEKFLAERRKELESLKVRGVKAIAEAEAEFKDLIKKAAESGGTPGREITAFHQVKQGLQDVIYPRENRFAPLADPREGEVLMVRSLGICGSVAAVNRELNQVELEVRGIRVKTSIEDLARPDGGGSERNRAAWPVSKVTTGRMTSPARELNLIGLTVDEAIPEVDKMLDQAQVKGLGTLSIIHGKGTGRLREAVRMFMKTDARVKSFHPGADRAGGEGVTVVELTD